MSSLQSLTKGDRGVIASLRRVLLVPVLVGVIAVAGCTGPVEYEVEHDINDPEGFKRARSGQEYGNLFGEGGILGGDKGSQGGQIGIGVNAFLWRATLDTISFMPVTVADPFGGVVLTDWRESTDSPGERYKMNIYILGRELRADGVRVTVLKQELQDGIWRDRNVGENVSVQIEDAILSRARQFRRETISREQ
ncbi:MAG: DUF3576 domain-containing protein [Rhodospirillales bacterium]